MAASSAQVDTDQVSKPLSPTRDATLPPDNQNKPTPESVSNSSPHSEFNNASEEQTSSFLGANINPINREDEINPGSHDQQPNPRDSAPPEVSDNIVLSPMASPIPTMQPAGTIKSPPPFPPLSTSTGLSLEDPFDSKPDDPWHFTFTELRAMRSRMLTLEKLDETTQSLSNQLQAFGRKIWDMETQIEKNSKQVQALSTQSSKMDTQVDNNTHQLKELQKEVLNLKKVVQDQQQLISNLKQIKSDFKQDKDDFSKKSRKAVTEMNTLVDAQREQVESFRAIRNEVRQTSQEQSKQINEVKQISQEQTKQITKISHDVKHNSLKDQAFRKCNNIAIIGLAEDSSRSAYAIAMKFFKNVLKLKKIDIDVAYRVGQPPRENSTYIRPLIVKFTRLADRNAVWHLRNDIPQTEDQQRIKIQADLPRQLRQDVAILYKVANAAAATKEYKSAHVRDYALILDGKEYTAPQLEQLPLPLRPTSLAVKKTDSVLIFFSRYCELSNHFPSVFTYQDNTFHNMEHYLAYRRAVLSQQQDLIERTLQIRDPVEAKSVLNQLRKDHEQEWQRDRMDITTEGIRAKFQQNEHLSSFLRNTDTLTLGEASKDTCWGIGMMLDNKNATDSSKWTHGGNLLGAVLMQVRQELKQQPERSGNKDNSTTGK